MKVIEGGRVNLLNGCMQVGEFFYDYFREMTVRKSVISFDRLFVIFKILQYLKFDHAAAEVGVFRAGSSYLIAKFMKDHNITQPLSMYDTFEGIPEVNVRYDAHKAGDFNETSLENVVLAMQEFDNVEINKGKFPQDFKGHKFSDKYSFVHLDVDIYQSYKDCLEFFYPRMVEGGVMLFDDYDFPMCGGAKIACDDFFSDKKEELYGLTTKQGMVMF